LADVGGTDQKDHLTNRKQKGIIKPPTSGAFFFGVWARLNGILESEETRCVLIGSKRVSNDLHIDLY
jgi:hypothetical protein